MVEVFRASLKGISILSDLKSFNPSRICYSDPIKNIGLEEIIITNNLNLNVISIRMKSVTLGERWDVGCPEISMLPYDYTREYNLSMYNTINISGYKIEMLELRLNSKIVESGIQFSSQSSKYMILPSSSPMYSVIIQLSGSDIVNDIGEESEYEIYTYRVAAIA